MIADYQTFWRPVLLEQIVIAQMFYYEFKPDTLLAKPTLARNCAIKDSSNQLQFSNLNSKALNLISLQISAAAHEHKK